MQKDATPLTKRYEEGGRGRVKTNSISLKWK
jgi:hypothetical protein